MADYTTNRSAEKFTYKRVSWADFATADREVATYTQFTQGGHISRGAYTTLKTTGSFPFAGDPPDTTDLLRIYYSFTDAEGNRSEEHALGTFLVGFDRITNTPGNGGLIQTGTVSGYSTLKVLQDRLLGLPLTIPAGADPIQYAAAIIRNAGLRANVQQDTLFALNAPHTFEPEDSELTVVNWCLTNCATPYQAASVDGYGIIQVQPYEPPTARTPVQTFRDDANSIMQPAVEEENEWQTAANVARLYFEDDTRALWAEAKNTAGSRASLANRGNREVTYYERVDEIADLDALKALAITRLMDRSAEIERVNLSHAFVPIQAGDAVAIEYADRTWSGTVQNMEIRLTPSAPCTTQLRRTVSAALDVAADGGVIWEITE